MKLIVAADNRITSFRPFENFNASKIYRHFQAVILNKIRTLSGRLRSGVLSPGQSADDLTVKLPERNFIQHPGKHFVNLLQSISLFRKNTHSPAFIPVHLRMKKEDVLIYSTRKHLINSLQTYQEYTDTHDLC